VVKKKKPCGAGYKFHHLRNHRHLRFTLADYTGTASPTTIFSVRFFISSTISSFEEKVPLKLTT
jgi:hypothetical protein